MLRSPLYLAAGCALDAEPVALVDAAARAGFDGLGLRLSHDHALDQRGIERLGARLREAGVRLHDVEVHRLGPASPDPAPLVDAAAALGASFVLVVSDLADDDETLTRLGEFSATCRAGGVTAALEYMAWTTPHASAAAVAMARDVDCVVVVDVLHHHRLGESPEALADVVSSGRLGWVQLCDAGPEVPDGIDALVHEARHGRLPPGHGDLPLADLLQAVPPGTPVSVEVQSDTLGQRSVDERAELLFQAATATLAAAHEPRSTG